MNLELDDVKRELRNVRDRHPRGRDEVLDIMREHGDGVTNADDITILYRHSVYEAARARRCSAAILPEEAHRILQMFREELSRLEQAGAKHWYQQTCAPHLMDRHASLLSLAGRYGDAKAIGPEHAYPLVPLLDDAERSYRARVSQLAGLVTEGGNFPTIIAPKLGREQQLSKRLAATEAAQSCADCVAAERIEFDAAERIEAGFIEDYKFASYAQLRSKWAAMARDFEKREQAET